MATRGGGGGNNGGGIPAASRKMVQSLKEIVNGVTEAEIYSTLKECNMDPNEAVNRLLSQDTFHEVKSKREKKKEFKDTTEPRPRGGGSTSTRGARSGADRYAGRSGSSQFNSSESGGLHGKPTYKRENGTSSFTASTAPISKAAPRNTNWHQPNFSDAQGPESEVPSFSAVDGVSVSQPSSGYQSAWGASGQKSMADIVKMGRPQNKGYSTSNPPQQSINQHYVPPPPPNVSHHELPSEDYSSQVPETHPDYGPAADQYASPDNEWPSIEQPHAVGVHPVLDSHAESGFNSGQSSLPFERSNQYLGYETNEVEEQDESYSEEDIENDGGPASDPSRKLQEDTSVTAPLYDNDSYGHLDSYPPHDAASEHKEVEEGDAPISSVSANIQNLSIHEEKHTEEPEEDVPSVVIPDHLQVHTADCSHLSFGSFGASMNSGFSGPFGSRTLINNVDEAPAEPVGSSIEHSENTNLEYYEDGSARTSESNLVQRTGASAENYDLASASQTAALKQEDPEVIHGNQYGFPPSTHAHTFNGPQMLNQSFPQSQTPAQTQISTPFLNVMQQAAHTNSLPSTLLAANGHPVRESDLSYSQFSVGQSMPTRYGNSASSISDPSISMAEALKTAGLSSSQPAQHTPAGNTHPTGPTLPQHLVHPYSQPTVPLGYANMISYPFLPQSYTYMPSGFQPAFAGNSTYHQQLAAMLPQYKNSVSVSSLPPQSAAVASGYGSFGNSTPIPGNYQVNQAAGPAGSTISYEDVLNAHYKDNQQLLSLQQNENNPMWVHGGGSRGVPASAYYGLQSQNQQQQPSGFRQGGQQSYGGAGLNYQDFFHSQGGEHQNPNPREGSQGQPKLQSQQQLWQNSY